MRPIGPVVPGCVRQRLVFDERGQVPGRDAIFGIVGEGAGEARGEGVAAVGRNRVYAIIRGERLDEWTVGGSPTQPVVAAEARLEDEQRVDVGGDFTRVALEGGERDADPVSATAR